MIQAFKSCRQQVLLLAALFSFSISKSQNIANYIANGSFEEYYDCAGPTYPLLKAKFWLSIDSNSYGGGYYSRCNSLVPWNGNTYQYPRTGDTYIISTWFYPGATANCFCGRGYLKNRLRANLQSGKTYCVRFYVSIANTSPRGMDGFGVYFGGNSIDTITHCLIPLSFIAPQIYNPQDNVISDTLNWVPVTGTFVATGTEKYALLGNFLADNAVTTASINTPFYPQNWTDVLIDDVSCIDIDLPAYAGPDQPLLPGDSAYIGREHDFALDEACVWYQLPNAITPIDTTAGLWVKPATTTTYVVKQQIWCSSVKYDTVVVFTTALGITELQRQLDKIQVYPSPAQDILHMQWPVAFENEQAIISIYSNLGQLLKEKELSIKETGTIDITDLPGGTYQMRLSLKSKTNEAAIKKLLIAR